MKDLHEPKSLRERIHSKEDAQLSLRPSFHASRMSIEITNHCNHRCVFCPCRNLNRKHCSIDESLFYRLVKEGKDIGVHELALHMLGEPLVNKNAAKYIKYAKDIGYNYVYLTTNGSLATPEKIIEIFDAGLDSIKFSINAGTAESYLAVHGKDDFETVKRNLENCHEYRRKSNKTFNIFISCVLTKRTLPEVQVIREVFSKYVDDIVFAKLINRGGVLPDEIRVDPESAVLEENSNPTACCQHPFTGIYVTCEGILAPCCMDGDLNYNMGYLHNTSLANALYSEKVIAFRQMHMDSSLKGTYCEKCLNSQSNWIGVYKV